MRSPPAYQNPGFMGPGAEGGEMTPQHLQAADQRRPFPHLRTVRIVREGRIRSRGRSNTLISWQPIRGGGAMADPWEGVGPREK